jgi:Spy/CpxP family protein refolding chaperone
VTDRPRALAVLITVFLLGCLLGFAGSYYWFGKTVEHGAAGRENSPPRIQEPPRLSELLKLTPEQDQRFHEIMAEAREQLDALRFEQDEMREALRAKQGPKIERIWAETNHKFSAILDEEQKKKFEDFLKDMEAMRKRQPSRGRGFEPRR